MGKCASCLFLLEWCCRWNSMGGKIIGVEPRPTLSLFCDALRGYMPIASIGGILCDVLFNPKYAGCVHKVTVAIDNLGNIVWICGAVWVT